MQSVLGIDVSKDKLDIILRSGEKKQHQVISNELKGYQYLERWLLNNSVGQVHVCLEATGQYGEPIAEYLYARGYLVSVVNPARIKRYGESKLHRNKTDKADADLIAEFCQKEIPTSWKPLSTELKHLRALVRRLNDLKTNRRQEINRLRSGERDPWVIEELTIHIEFLDGRIKHTEKEMREFMKQTTELKEQQELLRSIPGIGELTANVLLAEIGDISVFEGAPQLAAFAGLNPKGHRSGSSVNKKTRISKEGRTELRYCLYMPAVVALSCNPIIMDLNERLTERHLHKMEIVVASMRKLLHIVYGVLKNGVPFDPQFGDQFQFSS